MSFRRLILPALLILVGAWLLAGCIYIPTFNATVEGKDIRGKTSRAIQVDACSHDDVRKALGEPYFKTSDGRYWVYSWKNLGGFVVWPFCFTAGSESHAYAITFEFDDGEVLRRTFLDDRFHNMGLTEQQWRDPHQFVPDRVRDYEDLWRARQMFEQSNLKAATHPTTPELRNAP
jgi:hypothetical protein